MCFYWVLLLNWLLLLVCWNAKYINRNSGFIECFHFCSIFQWWLLHCMAKACTHWVLLSRSWCNDHLFKYTFSNIAIAIHWAIYPSAIFNEFKRNATTLTYNYQELIIHHSFLLMDLWGWFNCKVKTCIIMTNKLQTCHNACLCYNQPLLVLPIVCEEIIQMSPLWWIVPTSTFLNIYNYC